jgi:hypothetical protein
MRLVPQKWPEGHPTTGISGIWAFSARGIVTRGTGKEALMLMRWIWRAVAVFLGRKAWEAYQRRREAQRSPAERVRRAARH